MPNYAMRRDRRRQKNSGGAKRYYKQLMHRFERRIAKIALRSWMIE
jgi:hypothetical protein